MRVEALQLLRDPVSGVPLRYEPSLSRLVNPGTGAVYPISDGIVRFIWRESVTGSNRRYMKFYDSYAPLYDLVGRVWANLFKGGEERMRREFLDQVEIRPNNVVLEVSVGTGGNLPWLPRDASYYGLDISAGMLARCRKRLRRCGCEAVLVQGEAEHLPFADEVFDVVFHLGAINFFNDKPAALREMVRVAKPGTTLVVADATERVVSRYGRALGYYPRSAPVSPPVEWLPAGMLEVRVSDMWDGDLYCFSFRKPVGITTSAGMNTG